MTPSTTATADTTATEQIVIEGAREHNLRDVSVRIPKNKITVFTGVSGSGKSSLVFATLAVEAQRQLNETFPTFVRNRLPRHQRPEADVIDHLSTAVVVDQKPIGANARSTVGTATDIAPIIRLLFSRCGEPSAGMATAYSFNTPEGACPTCAGLGHTIQPDLDRFFDVSRSLNEGALLFPMFNVGGVQWNLFTRTGRFDLDKPLENFSAAEWERLLHGEPGSTAAGDEGLVPRFHRLYLGRDTSGLSARTRKAVEEFTIQGLCPTCHGARLNQAALKTQVNGHTITDHMAMEVTELIQVLGKVDHPLGTPLARQASAGLRRLDDIGLGYLNLGRETSTLSGGESQRLKMVRFLGSSLTGMTYIFDEPSTGLHPRDVGRMNTLLRRLRDRGNTVLVVEHDRDVIAAADHVIDLGPGAGTHGGHIVHQGTPDGLRHADTTTGRALRRRPALKTSFRAPTGHLTIENADVHNLKNLTLQVPTGVLTVFTGVAGSGKSTLVTDVLARRHPDALLVGQAGIAASSRSTPVSHLGVMDTIRKSFADATGVQPGLFSFNSRGACPACKGRGEITADMAYMDPVTTTCETCAGSRYAPEVLQHTLNGKNIVEVLALTAEEAATFFTERALTRKIGLLNEVGLGYLTLGQPLSTLSGGERQRLKLAGELHKTGRIYILDEPTTGLHMSDTQTLLALLDRFVDAGNTMLVIEHDLDVIEHADHIIDLGPDGGRHGGQLLFSGTPAQLLHHPTSHTARVLRDDLNANPTELTSGPQPRQ